MSLPIEHDALPVEPNEAYPTPAPASDVERMSLTLAQVEQLRKDFENLAEVASKKEKT